MNPKDSNKSINLMQYKANYFLPSYYSSFIVLNLFISSLKKIINCLNFLRERREYLQNNKNLFIFCSIDKTLNRGQI